LSEWYAPLHVSKEASMHARTTASSAIPQLILGLLLTSLVAAPSRASDEPERHPSPVPPQAELIPDLPEAPAVIMNDEALRLLEAAPFGPDDKGSTYTDMGLGRTGAPLTERERAILALARSAVEASRAAGTLEIAPPPETRLAPALDAEAAKLERLHTGGVVEPAPVPGDPNTLRSMPAAPEFVGPVLPSAEELAKLERAASGARTETPATEVK
jgi:hypothetical protein